MDRLKVLSNVSVCALQDALTKGFAQAWHSLYIFSVDFVINFPKAFSDVLQVGHRNLRSLCPFLEGMSWKTAASRHIEAYVVMAPLLICLLSSSGLLPDAVLQKAAFACHHEAPFTCGEGVTFDAAMNYFLLKARQLAAKLRGLLANTSEWSALSRKLSQQQRDCFLAMPRALQPNFCMESFDETETCPVQPASQLKQNVAKPEQPVNEANMENQTCLQLAKIGPSFAVALDS